MHPRVQVELRWATARTRRLSTTPRVNVRVEPIYQVDNKRLYWSQDRLEAAAREVGVPRVWSDDVWGDRTREDA